MSIIQHFLTDKHSCFDYVFRFSINQKFQAFFFLGGQIQSGPQPGGQLSNRHHDISENMFSCSVKLKVILNFPPKKYQQVAALDPV